MYITVTISMETTNALKLRQIVGGLISPTIVDFRKSKNRKTTAVDLETLATDEEIDEFILSNPYFDEELATQLSDEGFLGFEAKEAKIHGDWKDEFVNAITKWMTSYYWLRSPNIKFVNSQFFESDENEVWRPSLNVPIWINNSPSYHLIARAILENKGSLTQMHPRDFEELIGELLQKDGWDVKVTRITRDEGIDVIAQKQDLLLGEIKTIWQAKKYSGTNKVTLSDVRELSAVSEASKATKGIIVTTNKLTKSAIEWVRRDLYRLNYLEGNQIEEWVLGKKITF